MTDTQDKIAPKDGPEKTPNASSKALLHLEAKRAQNLRDNLLKRKQQAKARSEEKN